MSKNVLFFTLASVFAFVVLFGFCCSTAVYADTEIPLPEKVRAIMPGDITRLARAVKSHTQGSITVSSYKENIVNYKRGTNFSFSVIVYNPTNKPAYGLKATFENESKYIRSSKDAEQFTLFDGQVVGYIRTIKKDMSDGKDKIEWETYEGWFYGLIKDAHFSIKVTESESKQEIIDFVNKAADISTKLDDVLIGK